MGEIKIEDDIQKILYDLVNDQDVKIYENDRHNYTQLELPSDSYAESEVQEYVEKIDAAMAKLGEEGESHYLTVDNLEIDEYLSS